MTDDHAKTWDEFHDVVNLTASGLESWLETDEVAQRRGQS